MYTIQMWIIAISLFAIAAVYTIPKTRLNEKNIRNDNNIQTKDKHQRKVGTNEQATKKNIEPTNQRDNRE